MNVGKDNQGERTVDNQQEALLATVANVRKALVAPQYRPQTKKFSLDDPYHRKEVRNINAGSLILMVTSFYGLYLYEQDVLLAAIAFRAIILMGILGLSYVFANLIFQWIHSRKKEEQETAAIQVDVLAEWQAHYFKPLKKDVELMNKEFPEFRFKLNDVGEVLLEGTGDFKMKTFDNLVSTKIHIEK